MNYWRYIIDHADGKKDSILHVGWKIDIESIKPQLEQYVPDDLKDKIENGCIVCEIYGKVEPDYSLNDEERARELKRERKKIDLEMKKWYYANKDKTIPITLKGLYVRDKQQPDQRDMALELVIDGRLDWSILYNAGNSYAINIRRWISDGKFGDMIPLNIKTNATAYTFRTKSRFKKL